MSVTLSIRENSSVSVVDLSGRVTMGEGTTVLRDTLRDITSKGQLKILLNLADVSYIDSSGMCVLVSSFATIAGLGGELKLLNMAVRVKDLLLLTKLYTVFEVYDDETAASPASTVSRLRPLSYEIGLCRRYLCSIGHEQAHNLDERQRTACGDRRLSRRLHLCRSRPHLCKRHDR